MLGGEIVDSRQEQLLENIRTRGASIASLIQDYLDNPDPAGYDSLLMDIAGDNEAISIHLEDIYKGA